MKRIQKKIQIMSLVLAILMIMTSCGVITPSRDTQNDSKGTIEPGDDGKSDENVGKTSDDTNSETGEDTMGNSQKENADTTRPYDFSAAELMSFSDPDNFTAALWKNLRSNENDNFAFSPLSAYYALLMCANGADGDTLKAFEMLGFTAEELEEANSEIKELTEQLVSESDKDWLPVVKVANSVWVDDEFAVLEKYMKALSDNFEAETFSGNLPLLKNKMNSWIEDKTEGLIKNMISDISDDSRLILINALYFRAKWQSVFNSEGTFKRDFNCADGSVKETDFMWNGKGNELVVDDKNFEGVVRKYRGGQYEFVALMPKKGDLGAAVELLNDEYSISDIAESAENTYTNLVIPKFELECKHRLEEALSNMGLSIAFDPANADFSKMGTCKNGDPVYISEVLQKCVIKVTEDGTEAAAATVINAKAMAMIEEKQPRELIFDKPFIFAIIEEDSGAVLFAGEYNFPSEG